MALKTLHISNAFGFGPIWPGGPYFQRFPVSGFKT